jgi:uridine phosphorylase
MRQGEAVINPQPEAWEARVPSRAILTFARPDYHLLSRLAQAGAPRYLWDCPIREGQWQSRRLAIVGPAPGAPYAVMVLEKLIALGARAVLVLGWCGSLQSEVEIGTLVLPTSAVSADGTSRHYHFSDGDLLPDPGLTEVLRHHLQSSHVPWRPGAIWTTDAFYRETVSAVRHYQGRGILGVDLELAALFAVGHYRQVPVAGLLVVSDELATLSWHPGYRSARFRQARDLAARLMLAAAAHGEASNA